MKDYLIIGGNSGIGLALARRLSMQGHNVYTASRNEPVDSDNTKHIRFDVLNGQEITLPLEKLDGLIYTPGSINLKPFHRLKVEDFVADYQINVVGAVKVIQQTLPLLKNSDSASIILFSTVAVQQGMPFHSSVSAAKGAIEGLVRSLAAELAPKIRVNAIAPSLVDTPLASRLLSSEAKIESAGNRHPLQRVGSPEDVAGMAEFLLGDQSSWVSGQILGVDGGMSTLRV